MTENQNLSDNSDPSIGDLAGVGQLINSEVAKRTYSDALSPSMKVIGGLTEDTLKTLRLFTAPFQLAAAYQDRFRAFCDRVRAKVPEEEQQDAPPEILALVMEAFVSTSDDGPLMEMFEELMAKAIDKREANKLSPQFPSLIRSLSPLEALLIADLYKQDQYTDDLFDCRKRLITQRIGANFDFKKFGGHGHHLTLSQNLKEKNIVVTNDNEPVDVKQYPNLQVPEGLTLKRTSIKLSMFGRWFATSCVAQ